VLLKRTHNHLGKQKKNVFNSASLLTNFTVPVGDIKIAPPPKKVEKFGDLLLWVRSLLESISFF
jgi:hypothetical protein